MLAPSLNQSKSSTVLTNFSQNNLNTSHEKTNRRDEYNPLQKPFCHPDLWKFIVNCHYNTACYDDHRLAG